MAVFCQRIVLWFLGCEMSELNYPLPRPNAHTEPYWSGIQDHQLRYQQCDVCDAVQLIPRSLCEHCHSVSLQWKTSMKKGRVLTYTIVHRAPLPIFKSMTPYAIVIVNMEEGFRVMANALPEAQPLLKIGSQVEIEFQNVHGMTLPIVGKVLEASL